MPARPGEPERYAWRDPVEVMCLHKGAPIRIDVPAGKETVVDLRLRREIPRPRWLPDLAVSRRDIRVEGEKLLVTVHNIGGRAAGAFSVICQNPDASGARELCRARLEGLPAPAGFEPVAREIELPLPAGASLAKLRIALDPAGEVDEICESNNEAPARVRGASNTERKESP